MAGRQFRPEQIINKLREAEVLISKDSTIGSGQQDNQDHQADVLPLAQRVWRHGCGTGQARKRTGEGKREALRLVADLSLDNASLKEAAPGNS